MTKSLQLCLLVVSASFITWSHASAESVAITNVNVIDVVGGAVRPDQNILVTDGPCIEFRAQLSGDPFRREDSWDSFHHHHAEELFVK